jgi:hypothetical protein
MFPSGIVMVAEIVATPMRQLLMPMISGAPTLSVSVIVTGEEEAQLTSSRVIPLTPMYVLVEKVDVVKELEGVSDCSKVAFASMVRPFKPKISGPLSWLKVADTV